MTSYVKRVVLIRDELEKRYGLDVRSLTKRIKVVAEAQLNGMFGGDFHAGRMLKAAAERAAGHFSRQEFMRALVGSISQRISTANRFQGRSKNADST